MKTTLSSKQQAYGGQRKAAEKEDDPGGGGWVSSFSTAHQHILNHSVPENGVKIW